MAERELEEIRLYWSRKYPNVDIMLYPSSSSQKYYGRMQGAESTIDLSADTIGELISQGEAFLRSLR